MSVSAIVVTNWVFGVGGIVFIISMVPTLLNKRAVIPLSTSVPTALTVSAFLVPYALLGTWFAFGSEAAFALTWALVAIYRRP